MSLAKVHSAQVSLLTAKLVDVEVDLSRGLHAFTIVGLPDKAVEEAKDRVAAAIKNSGFTSPKQKNQKVVISLAPADIKKEGSGFDVAMAVAYLLAGEEVSFNPQGKLFLGELSLTGEIRSISGVLPMVRFAKDSGFSEVYVPEANAKEAALIDNIAIFPIHTLRELLNHLDGGLKEHARIHPQEHTKLVDEKLREERVDFKDIRGQHAAKRGLIIAASGGHNIALFGPPGTGKTLLAKALAHILPSLSFEETLEVTGIHSIVRSLSGELLTRPPFRAPHHTASYVAVVGGGAYPKPGEVTLAHRGVLFMDEFPEFERRVIEALREPLEERVVSVSRAKGTAQFPASFMLVAAFNPCPCGNFGSSKPCICSPLEINRYHKKLSGPMLDRIDMWIEVGHVDFDTLAKSSREEDSDKAALHVRKARKRQGTRFKKKQGVRLNSHMSVKDIDAHIRLSSGVEGVLKSAVSNLGLSPRSYHRVLKVARTIADLENAKEIQEAHVLEALQYRPKNTTV